VGPEPPTPTVRRARARPPGRQGAGEKKERREGHSEREEGGGGEEGGAEGERVCIVGAESVGFGNRRISDDKR